MSVNQPNGSPRHSYDPTHPDNPLYSGSAFRIGNPEYNHETTEEGKRILHWIPGQLDGNLSVVAGWAELPHGTDADGFGFLEIPAGTRSATTILSGLEAWEGEKADILGFVATYEKHASRITGQLDVGVVLDSVAVTKDRKMFIVPPHRFEAEPNDVGEWFMNLASDLNQVLVLDPKREVLMEKFFGAIAKIGTEEGTR